MAAAASQPASTGPEQQSSPVPDYLTDADAVLKDLGAKWRYGRPPDYSKTRKVYAETRQMNHEAGSLIQMVENLVKNWEIEASFKPRLEDWRTVDARNYTFAINGNPPQTAEHMLKVGTYNAIISPNEYYSPENSDFASSHKTFKRMMPTFAWEVLEVYSGPPQVAFRWRHWGVMKNDYVGFNNNNEKVTAKAHGGSIDIQGVTVATVDDKVRLQRVETWFDPMDMFRQIAPHGIVNKEPVARRVSRAPTPVADTTPTPSETLPQQQSPQSQQLPSNSRPNPESHEERFVPEESVPMPPASTITNLLPQPEGSVCETKADENLEQRVKPPQPPHIDSVNGSLAPSTDVAASTQPVQQQPQPSIPAQGPAELGPESFQELEQWHEASSILDEAATGCEMEHFHDAVEADHGFSTASSEAGSWTAVTPPASDPPTPRRSTYSSSVTSASDQGQASSQTSPTEAFFSECPAHKAHPHPKDVEHATSLAPGEGAVAAPDSEEAKNIHLEMRRITAFECPFLMNRE